MKETSCCRKVKSNFPVLFRLKSESFCFRLFNYYLVFDMTLISLKFFMSFNPLIISDPDRTMPQNIIMKNRKPGSEHCKSSELRIFEL